MDKESNRRLIAYLLYCNPLLQKGIELQCIVDSVQTLRLENFAKKYCEGNEKRYYECIDKVKNLDARL